MPKIPALIEAEKALVDFQNSLATELAQAFSLEGQAAMIRDEIDRKLAPFVKVFEKAAEAQRNHLTGWYHTGQKCKLYHQRYQLSGSDEQQRGCWVKSAWLRKMLHRPNGGFDYNAPGTWKVTMTFDYPGEERRRDEVVVPGDTMEEWFANADKILEEAGWSLTEYTDA